MSERKIIGLRPDGYIAYMEGLYEVLLDVGGQVIIGAEKCFRSIGEFNHGIAIAYYYNHDPKLGGWGLVDNRGDAITEFCYWGIKPLADDLYLVDVTPGLRKNVMRRDGTLVFKESYQDIYEYRHGYFIASNTIRKTKNTPTRYVKGLLHRIGIEVLPLEYSRMKWLDDYSYTCPENSLGESYDILYLERDGYVGTVKTSWLSVKVDEITVDAPLFWKGVLGSVCEGCIYSGSIPSGGRGCGKLFAHSFRERYVKGHCEYRKEDLSKPSVYEQQRIEYWKNKQRAAFPLDEQRKLLRDFIAEHLDGDINRLASFDLRKLEGMKRYGDTHGRAFNPYNTDLVKAIAALIFQDIAKSEVLFDKKRGTLNLLPAPLIKEDLWGNQVGDQFVMMSFFPHKDKASVSRRIEPCATLCNTIGNLYLHPLSFDEYRHSHAHGRFLIDHTFADLHKVLTGGTPSKQMKKAVSDARDFFEPYRGDDGWLKLMQQWMTMGLVDYFYNPEPFFDEVTFTTYMPSEVYYRAIEHSIAICHEIIPTRAEQMVRRLKDVL